MQHGGMYQRKYQDTRSLAIVFTTGCNIGEITYISSEMILFHQNNIQKSAKHRSKKVLYLRLKNK